MAAGWSALLKIQVRQYRLSSKQTPRTCEPCLQQVLDSVLSGTVRSGGTVPLPAECSVQGARSYWEQCIWDEMFPKSLLVSSCKGFFSPCNFLCVIACCSLKTEFSFQLWLGNYYNFSIFEILCEPMKMMFVNSHEGAHLVVCVLIIICE